MPIHHVPDCVHATARADRIRKLKTSACDSFWTLLCWAITLLISRLEEGSMRQDIHCADLHIVVSMIGPCSEVSCLGDSGFSCMKNDRTWRWFPERMGHGLAPFLNKKFEKLPFFVEGLVLVVYWVCAGQGAREWSVLWGGRLTTILFYPICRPDCWIHSRTSGLRVVPLGVVCYVRVRLVKPPQYLWFVEAPWCLRSCAYLWRDCSNLSWTPKYQGQVCSASAKTLYYLLLDTFEFMHWVEHRHVMNLDVTDLVFSDRGFCLARQVLCWDASCLLCTSLL